MATINVNNNLGSINVTEGKTWTEWSQIDSHSDEQMGEWLATFYPSMYNGGIQAPAVKKKDELDDLREEIVKLTELVSKLSDVIAATI